MNRTRTLCAPFIHSFIVDEWETTNLRAKLPDQPSLFGPATPKVRFAENYPPGMHTANRAKFLRSAGP
jgi:hypothetical protein